MPIGLLSETGGNKEDKEEEEEDWSHKAREARALGGVARGGTFSTRKILDFIPSEIIFGAVLGRNSKSWTTNCYI